MGTEGHSYGKRRDLRCLGIMGLLHGPNQKRSSCELLNASGHALFKSFKCTVDFGILN